MIRRAIAVLTAASALLLTGCAGPTPAPAPDSEPAGAAIANVSVLGETWSPPTVTIGDISALDDETEREIVAGGGGAPIADDSLVIASAVIYDAASKQEQGEYQPIGQVLDMASPDLDAIFRDLFLGVPSGSRIAALVPGSVLAAAGPSQPGAAPSAPMLIVADVASLEHTAAWGAPQEPTQQLVVLGPDAADGGPGAVTIDESQPAPTSLVLDIVKTGDGAAVMEGQSVTVQYRGMLYPSGEEFDSSWSRGMPAQFATDAVVPGFSQALVGRTIGSRVIAIIPPELGYGAQGSSPTIPPNSTLVFVIDILAAN